MDNRKSTDNLPSGAHAIDVENPNEIESSMHEVAPEDHEGPFEWTELIRIVFIAFAAAAVWFHVWEPFPHISVSVLRRL